MSGQEKLIKEIMLLSDSIRSKQKTLRMDIKQREDYLQSTFQPVVAPLKDIAQAIAREPLRESDIISPIKGEPIGQPQTSGAISSAEEGAEEEDDEDDDEDEIMESGEEREQEISKSDESNLSRLGKDIQHHGVLGRKYVVKMLHGTLSNRIHHVYGARLEKDGLMIGNSELTVDESDNIIIRNKAYPGTIGLFELIFKKTPIKYNNRDLKVFKQICLATHLHKKHYKDDSPVHRGASMKYKTIIAPLFTSVKGRGMVQKSAMNTNVIYYNNINKLVERMKLLHEARGVGHTGVGNELVALTEELRQRGYID